MQAQNASSSAMHALAHSDQRTAYADAVQLCVSQLVAVAILLLLLPVMLTVAALIMLRDGSPVIFGHYRVGLRGRLFRCYKFRSMYRNADEVLANLLRTDAQARAEWERDQKLSDDPRITPIGRFLRRTSLDELPQLLNVLRGEMCLVGPRPITVAELTRYGRVRWDYLSVRPGLTGLWQVSGRNNTSYEERVAFDREYVDKRSPWLDLKILLKTIKVVVARDGAR